jgi:hypothetical protein
MTATDSLPTAPERYDSLTSFYGAHARRRPSPELDVGLWWRESADGPLYRAAWVRDTGELYLVQLGPVSGGGGRVEVLARTRRRERLELMLDGWRERCGHPRSLSWLRERAQAIAVRRFATSADSASGHRREPAPRALRSPRTAGTRA